MTSRISTPTSKLDVNHALPHKAPMMHMLASTPMEKHSMLFTILRSTPANTTPAHPDHPAHPPDPCKCNSAKLCETPERPDPPAHPHPCKCNSAKLCDTPEHPDPSKCNSAKLPHTLTPANAQTARAEAPFWLQWQPPPSARASRVTPERRSTDADRGGNKQQP